jgi:hypothetical protein
MTYVILFHKLLLPYKIKTRALIRINYELLCFAQQDLKIVHYYYPALLAMLKDSGRMYELLPMAAGFQNRPFLLSSIACNAAAMLQDSGRMYELLPMAAGFQNRPFFLSSIACNAAAMLQDSGRMYELLHIQEYAAVF